MTTSIVIGAGLGDEGKGRVVSHLVARNPKNALVVRFSGGHQAGHTVIYHGNKHIFSHFGSGTLQGVPTYWTKYCTVYPVGLKNEYDALVKICTPSTTIDLDCPVTTPYDIYANRQYDKKTGHGTCGVGVGKTFERHELLKLWYNDLFYPSVLKAKLENIEVYYTKLGVTGFDSKDFKVRMFDWNHAVDWLINNTDCNAPLKSLTSYDNLIFEGSQGLLLDQTIGFFPNVTRANVSSLNALEILKEADIKECDIYYVTRTYQTRHGNGPMANECYFQLNGFKNETNQKNLWQGDFRLGLLDIDMLKYAVDRDRDLYDTFDNTSFLAVTCIDQTGGKQIEMQEKGKIIKVNADQLYRYLLVDDTLFFASAATGDMISSMAV